jgi:hypothetical protein
MSAQMLQELLQEVGYAHGVAVVWRESEVQAPVLAFRRHGEGRQGAIRSCLTLEVMIGVCP